MKSNLAKLLALMLVLVLVLGMFAGCGKKAEPETPAEPATETPEEPATETPEEPAPEEPAVETHPNRVIFGSTTGVSGDIGPGAWWTNNADDKNVRDLINDYSTVTTDQGGAFVINETVCGGIETTENEDGTKTFTVKINEGLTYNNGEPMTAADFVAYALVSYSPEAKAAGAKISPDQVVGAPEYQNWGKALQDEEGNDMLDADGNPVDADGNLLYEGANKLSGLRLLDEYTYSITISSDYVPYFYELSYASLSPLYLPMYASADLTVKDDGDGAYLDGGKLVPEEIDAARWIYDHPVSAGPYSLVSLDTAACEAVLEINPYYAGNFEGQKPSIQQIICVKAVTETEFDALKTGAIDVLNQLTEGSEINTALDMVDAGGYAVCAFERNGYGKLMFQCDFGPTQFEAVRHAVAYLLDRNEFANQFCQGHGAVVHGPYGLCMWQYKDSEEMFADALDTYAYDPAKAIEILEADGWVLDAEGNDYTSGVRYKEVTAEEAGDYPLNVTLADGRILMPLHIMWSSSEGNPVSELLAVMLANGTQTADAGMVIEQTIMTFDELLLYMYRDATQGDKYGIPTYGMYNLATGFTPAYDQSYTFTCDPDLVAQGWNTNFLLDEELDQLTMDMVYGVDPSDTDTYLDLWQKFIIRWNQLLPEVPLYSNVYYTVYPEWLQGYEQSSMWEFNQAILYASVANAE